jgi:accessory colonization factor AcfC
MRVFSTRGAVTPVAAAARAWRQGTGRTVEVAGCDASCLHGDCDGEPVRGFLREVGKARYDLAVAGSEADMDDLARTGVCVRGTRRSLGLREVALLIPRGNPAGITRLEDLARPGVRVGISTLDCLRGAWEDVCARAGCVAEVGQNITSRVAGCMALEGRIVRGELDAAFGWSSSADQHSRIEAVRLPQEHRTLRSTAAAVIKGGVDPEGAKELADYLCSAAGWGHLAAAGWTVPPVSAR